MKTSDQNTTTTLKKKSLVLAALFTGASAIAMMTAAPAFAQEAEDEDEVVATGIRQSLKGAQDIKRSADTFVDAITSEDIGALPDRSVTEALQRVPGITISRFAAADDPDHFSIEGTDVVVRGLTYVSGEFNGRSSFSANNGRSLSFADVPPELLGSVHVFKNQTADLIEGGIAGTINLVTLKPFDKPGQVIAGSAELNYTDFRKSVKPNLSGLYSNRWETEIGEIGVRINGVTSELNSRSDGTQISSFQPRTDLGGSTRWAPEGAVVRSQDYDRARVGYGGALQWRSPDKTMEATAEYLRSEATTSWVERVSEIATDNVGDNAFFAVDGTSFDFGSDDLFSRGTLSAPIGWRSDQNGADPRTPIYGLQSNNVKRGVEQTYVTSDTSLNFKYTPNDKLSINLDYQHVGSTVDNVDMTLWGTTFQDLSLDLTRDGIPDVVYLAPNEVGDGAGNAAIDCSGGISNNCPSYFDAPHDSFADPYNSFWRAAMDHIEQSEGTQDAFRADVEYKVEGDWLQSVRFGGRYSKRDQTTRSSAYNWGALSEIWGGGGPVWMDEVGAPQHALETYTWDNFQRGEVTAPPAMPFYAGNPAQTYNESADFAEGVVATWNNGDQWERLSKRPGVTPGTNFLPGEVSDVIEETMAFYGMAKFGKEDAFANGMSINGNIGLRYVKTDINSVGFFSAPPVLSVPITVGDAPDENLPVDQRGENVCLTPIDIVPRPTPYEPDGICALSVADRAAATAFANGGSIARPDAEHSYEQWLPSFNVKLGISEDKVVRFGYSKGMSRPDVGQLRNYYTLSSLTNDDPRTELSESPDAGYRTGWYGFGGQGGNPYLNPVTAHNFDLSYEWYFDEVGSLTVSGFYKSIKNIIDTGTGQLSFTNNGVTYDDVYITSPGNTPDTGKVKGVEIAYQQFYDELPGLFSGLGVAATYTYIQSNGIRSSNVSSGNSFNLAICEAQAAADGDCILGEFTNLPTVPINTAELPLEGLSKHNANFAVIYEKGRVSTRLAYNWRSEYLVTARDVITPFYPVFQDATGQLDGSFFYSLNDNIKIGVSGANLLDTVTKTKMLLPSSDGRKGVRSFFRNDRRITFSVRGTF